MEKIFEAFAELILQHGLVGVIIAALLYTVYWVTTRYHEVQEARANGAQDFIKAVNDNTHAIRELRDEVINRRDHRA